MLDADADRADLELWLIKLSLEDRACGSPASRCCFCTGSGSLSLYLGVLLAVWATSAMTVGHLLFSVLITGYILIGIRLEERDLVQQFGDQYRRYRQHVLLPGRQVRRADVQHKACVEADQ